jgi:glycine cleavage system H protein
MQYPEELKYTEDHEWIRFDGDVATVGITDYAQGELGDIVYVDVNTVGDALEKGEIFGSVEAVKTVSDLFLPISGEILEINPALDGAPELVNNDPYGEGWMIRFKVTNPGEADDLMTVDAYKELVGA